MRRPPGKYLVAIRLALAQRAVDLGKGLKEAATGLVTETAQVCLVTWPNQRCPCERIELHLVASYVLVEF